MKFATLGPAGTCHDNATRAYARHFGLDDAEFVLVENFFIGIEQLHDRDVDYLIQNSAHKNVHLITERYHEDVKVVDAFVYPTKDMMLLERIDVENPRTIGLVPACEGYLDGRDYPEVISVVSKPLAAQRLLAGDFDAAVVHSEHYYENPGRFRVVKHIGAVITAWVVYGWDRNFGGEIMSTLPHEYFKRAAQNSRIPMVEVAAA